LEVLIHHSQFPSLRLWLLSHNCMLVTTLPCEQKNQYWTIYLWKWTNFLLMGYPIAGGIKGRSIYIKVTVCTYVLFSRPNRWTNLPQFCTDFPANSGKVLNTSMTPPNRPPDPVEPQTSKSKWVTGEKTLCNIICPDGWCKLIKFFPVSAGAWLASIE